jgi:cell wall-associated NlpC family hydrolase
MIGRLLTFVLMPLWIWVVLGGVGVVFVFIMALVLVIGGATSAIASDLHYQCDSAVGPDPSQAMTPSRASTAARPTVRSTPVSAVTATPTTNPYAELTIAPDDTSASDWQRACVTAMRDAPRQDPPLLTGNWGIGAECARELALAQLTASGARTGSGGRGNAAEFTRSVIYQASAALTTGRCATTEGTAAQQSAAGGAGQPSGSTRRACGQIGEASVVVLPNTIAAQGACGQRVDPSAVSAGDLVFWNYRNNAPTQVGIAVSDIRLVTTDATTGEFVELAIPSANDVRVKRVLGSGM